MTNTSIADLTLQLQNALDSNYNVVDMATVLQVITHLEGASITKEQLETTRLAMYINQLRRRTWSDQLARRLKNLLKKWREMVMPALSQTAAAAPGQIQQQNPNNLNPLSPLSLSSGGNSVVQQLSTGFVSDYQHNQNTSFLKSNQSHSQYANNKSISQSLSNGSGASGIGGRGVGGGGSGSNISNTVQNQQQHPLNLVTLPSVSTGVSSKKSNASGSRLTVGQTSSNSSKSLPNLSNKNKSQPTSFANLIGPGASTTAVTGSDRINEPTSSSLMISSVASTNPYYIDDNRSRSSPPTNLVTASSSQSQAFPIQHIIPQIQMNTLPRIPKIKRESPSPRPLSRSMSPLNFDHSNNSRDGYVRSTLSQNISGSRTISVNGAVANVGRLNQFDLNDSNSNSAFTQQHQQQDQRLSVHQTKNRQSMRKQQQQQQPQLMDTSRNITPLNMGIGPVSLPGVDIGLAGTQIESYSSSTDHRKSKKHKKDKKRNKQSRSNAAAATSGHRNQQIGLTMDYDPKTNASGVHDDVISNRSSSFQVHDSLSNSSMSLFPNTSTNTTILMPNNNNNNNRSMHTSIQSATAIGGSSTSSDLTFAGKFKNVSAAVGGGGVGPGNNPSSLAILGSSGINQSASNSRSSTPILSTLASKTQMQSGSSHLTFGVPNPNIGLPTGPIISILEDDNSRSSHLISATVALPASVPPSSTDARAGTLPVKRKRGRPRKNPNAAIQIVPLSANYPVAISGNNSSNSNNNSIMPAGSVVVVDSRSCSPITSSCNNSNESFSSILSHSQSIQISGHSNILNNNNNNPEINLTQNLGLLNQSNLTPIGTNQNNLNAAAVTSSSCGAVTVTGVGNNNDVIVGSSVPKKRGRKKGSKGPDGMLAAQANSLQYSQIFDNSFFKMTPFKKVKTTKELLADLQNRRLGSDTSSPTLAMPPVPSPSSGSDASLQSQSNSDIRSTSATPISISTVARSTPDLQHGLQSSLRASDDFHSGSESNETTMTGAASHSISRLNLNQLQLQGNSDIDQKPSSRNSQKSNDQWSPAIIDATTTISESNQQQKNQSQYFDQKQNPSENLSIDEQINKIMSLLPPIDFTMVELSDYSQVACLCTTREVIEDPIAINREKAIADKNEIPGEDDTDECRIKLEISCNDSTNLNAVQSNTFDNSNDFKQIPQHLIKDEKPDKKRLDAQNTSVSVNIEPSSVLSDTMDQKSNINQQESRKPVKSIFDLDYDEDDDPLNSYVEAAKSVLISNTDGNEASQDIDIKSNTKQEIKIPITIVQQQPQNKSIMNELQSQSLQPMQQNQLIEHNQMLLAPPFVLPKYELIENPDCPAKKRYEIQTSCVTNFHINSLHNRFISNVNGNWNDTLISNNDKNLIHSDSIGHYKLIPKLDELMPPDDLFVRVVPDYNHLIGDRIPKDLSHIKFTPNYLSIKKHKENIISNNRHTNRNNSNIDEQKYKELMKKKRKRTKSNIHHRVHKHKRRKLNRKNNKNTTENIEISRKNNSKRKNFDKTNVSPSQADADPNFLVGLVQVVPNTIEYGDNENVENVVNVKQGDDDCQTMETNEHSDEKNDRDGPKSIMADENSYEEQENQSDTDQNRQFSIQDGYNEDYDDEYDYDDDDDDDDYDDYEDDSGIVHHHEITSSTSTTNQKRIVLTIKKTPNKMSSAVSCDTQQQQQQQQQPQQQQQQHNEENPEMTKNIDNIGVETGLDGAQQPVDALGFEIVIPAPPTSTTTSLSISNVVHSDNDKIFSCSNDSDNDSYNISKPYSNNDSCIHKIKNLNIKNQKAVVSSIDNDNKKSNNDDNQQYNYKYYNDNNNGDENCCSSLQNSVKNHITDCNNSRIIRSSSHITVDSSSDDSSSSSSSSSASSSSSSSSDNDDDDNDDNVNRGNNNGNNNDRNRDDDEDDDNNNNNDNDDNNNDDEDDEEQQNDEETDNNDDIGNAIKLTKTPNPIDNVNCDDEQNMNRGDDESNNYLLESFNNIDNADNRTGIRLIYDKNIQIGTNYNQPTNQSIGADIPSSSSLLSGYVSGTIIKTCTNTTDTSLSLILPKHNDDSKANNNTDNNNSFDYEHSKQLQQQKEQANQNLNINSNNNNNTETSTTTTTNNNNNNNMNMQRFSEWHETLEVRSYNDEFLTILPYVVID